MQTPDFDTLAEKTRFSADDWRVAWELMVRHFGTDGQMSVWTAVRDGSTRVGGRPVAWVNSIIQISNAHPL